MSKKQKAKNPADPNKSLSLGQVPWLPEGKWEYPFLLSILVLGALFMLWDFLTFQKILLFKGVGSDSLNTFYPMMVGKANYIAEEGWPVKWSFNQGMGQNLFEGYNFHPLHVLDWIFGKWLLGEDYIAKRLAWIEFFKLLATGSIFWLYLKTLKFEPLPATLGAVLFAFCGYNLLGLTWYPHSLLLLHFALILLAFEQLFLKGRWWLFPLAIYFIGLNPRLVFFAEGLFIYGLFRFWDEKGFKLKEMSLLALKVAGLTALGLLFSADSLFTQMQLILDSPRLGADSHASKLITQGIFFLEEPLMYWSGIFRLFSNDLIGAGDKFSGWENYLESPAVYCGLLALLLLPQAFALMSPRRRLIYGIWGGIWLLMFLLPWFRYAYYGFSGDYFKNGFSLFATLYLLLTSLEYFRLCGKEFKHNKYLLLGTLIVLVGILFFPSLPAKIKIDQNVRLFSLLFLVFYSALFFLSDKLKINSWVLYGLILLAFVEVTYGGWYGLKDRPVLTRAELNSRTGYNDYTKEAIKWIKARDKGFFRISKNYYSSPAEASSLNDGMVFDFYGITSYSSFNQKYYIDFQREIGIIEPNREDQSRWAMGPSNKTLLHSICNVDYLLINTTNTDFMKRGYYNLVYEAGPNELVMKNNYSLPFGYTYNRFIPYSEFKKLKMNRRSYTMAQAVVLEDKEMKGLAGLEGLAATAINTSMDLGFWIQKLEERRSSHLELISHDQNHFLGKISLPKTEFLFFSIPFDKGWTATVNGKKQRLIKANIGFMGLKLKPGEYEIRLDFEPPYHQPGLIVVALSFLGFLGMIFFQWKKRKTDLA